MPPFPALNDINAAVTLNDGSHMPVLGFGTWQMEGQTCVDAVKAALNLGYRHIDTASIYGNEKAVGQAIRESGIARDELFVTTKLWNSAHAHVETAINASLDRLGLEHVDLYLIHWPLAVDFMAAWRGMEHVHGQGKTKSIGLSNCLVPHLDHADVPPCVNQVESHPWLQQPELLAYMQQHGIQGQAWSPLMQGRWSELDQAKPIAEKHDCTVPQVILRFLLQTGQVVLPKSKTPAHIASNAQLFQFTLDAQDMAAMQACNRNQRFGPDPMTNTDEGTDLPIEDPASGR